MVLSAPVAVLSWIADVELWKGKPAPAAGILQLSVANLALVVEPSDPLGIYVIKARVCDFIADRCVDLEQGVDAEDGAESSTRAEPSRRATRPD